MRGELDWVVMRCLEKDRSRRYDSASSLARDVERFLQDEPVEARPPSAWYRFRKMARRNRTALTTTGIVAAALVLGTAVSIWQAVRATRSENDAVEQRNEATEKRGEAETAKEQLRRTLYVAHLNLAQAAWEEGRIGEVLRLLEREKAASPDLCGFEWHYWMRQCHGDLQTLKLPGLSDWASFSADGTRLTSLELRDPKGVKIWEVGGGKELTSFSLPSNSMTTGPYLSADGARLAMGLGTAFTVMPTPSPF
jgi:hypothetical protein